MRQTVRHTVRDGIAQIEICNPPHNGLVPETRHQLWQALEWAESTDEVSAIVLCAQGVSFGLLVDPSLVNAESNGTAPTLRALCDRLEGAAKPVVAALTGTVLGPSADLALACHYRVAKSGFRFGFAEIRLGLTPQAGGALRLPRLVGTRMAVDMLLGGRMVSDDACTSGRLVDRLVQDHVLDASADLARVAVTEDLSGRRTLDRKEEVSDPGAWLAGIADARRKLGAHPPYVMRELLKVMEAGLLLPKSEAKEVDRSTHVAARRTDAARALCRLSRAERRAAGLSARLRAEGRDVKTIGIFGGGVHAVGFATAFLDAGYDVALATDTEGELDESFTRIGEAYDRRISSGEMTDDGVDERLDRLKMACGFRVFAPAGLVIDVASRTSEEAAHAAARIEAATGEDAVIAQLSPAARLSDVARGLERPGDVLGLRVFGAVRGTSGAEIVGLSGTDRTAAVTVFEVMRRIGKLPVLSIDDAEGAGIAARISAAAQEAADGLVAAGARPGTVETALRDWGLLRAVFAARHANSGAARQGAAAALGSVAVALDAEFPADGDFGPDVIRRLCLAAMVNEGARLVAEKIARSPSDIDVVAVHGLGFRRSVGGPMTEGDLAGLLSLRRALPRIGQRKGIGGTPHPLLDDLIKGGKTFEALDTG